jgi:hypothetical protein
MVEGSKVSRGVPADIGIAIPSAPNPIPNTQICSVFIRLPFPDAAGIPVSQQIQLEFARNSVES